MNIRVLIPTICYLPIYLLMERKGGREGGNKVKEEEREAGEMSKFCQLVDTVCYIMNFSLGSCSIFNTISNFKFPQVKSLVILSDGDSQGMSVYL